MTATLIPTIGDYERRAADPAPPISVVTTVRNGEKTLPRTIASVRAQDLPGLEYIVIDGGSNDGTLAVIRANQDIVSFWKSEPDRGISDGFNKGIALSTGKYVILLNADDWLSPGQLALGLETLEKTGADFVYGDLLYHNGSGGVLHRVRGEPDYAHAILHVMPALNHPTVIVRRTAYEQCGLFDLSWRYAMDYELLLRFHRAGRHGIYDPRMMGHMTLEGASDNNAAAALREVRDIAIAHGYPAPAAHLLFAYRLVKTRSRRAMEALFPRAISVALRHLFNRSVTSIK